MYLVKAPISSPLGSSPSDPRLCQTAYIVFPCNECKRISSSPLSSFCEGQIALRLRCLRARLRCPKDDIMGLLKVRHDINTIVFSPNTWVICLKRYAPFRLILITVVIFISLNAFITHVFSIAKQTATLLIVRV